MQGDISLESQQSVYVGSAIANSLCTSVSSKAFLELQGDAVHYDR